MRSPYRLVLTLLVGFIVVCGLGFGLYNLPPIHDRLAWRVADVISQVHDLFNPPEKVVFVPQDAQTAQNSLIATIVAATMRAMTPSATATCADGACATSTPACSPGGCQTQTPAASPTSTQTAQPTLTPTAIPGQVELKGIVHEYQKMNNCGPTNLAMALSFWGWQGDQMTTAAFLRPGFNPTSNDNRDDKNVMPYEMVDFVQQKTDLSIVERTGGDVLMLKHLVAAGFPVIVEKGYEPDTVLGWMGHYEVVNGYDDSKGIFMVQDSYVQPVNGITYADMESNWRAFDYTYLVIYPPAREAEVMAVLGPQADLAYNQQYTSQKAASEVQQLSGRDQFFALFDLGSSRVALQDYAGAAQAYDQAYQLYPSIPEKQRPYRMTWYQTGPYYAYYYTGRYTDVINLATQTIASTTSPGLEESFVWRARANIALGNTTDAVNDLKTALYWHPGFQPALDELANLGVTP
jgi:hypothetical protein